MSDNKPPTALLKKLAAIMAETDYIQKDKTVAFLSTKYRYASEQAIKEKLHPLLVKHGVLFFPSDIRQELIPPSVEKGEWFSNVTVEFTFIDSETGEMLRGSGTGTGSDKGDKAVYKAITGAIKYILTTTFLIPTGDDPEADSGEKPQAQRPQVKQPPAQIRLTDEQKTRLDNWCDANKITGRERIDLHAQASNLSSAQFETWLQDLSDKRENELPPSDTQQPAPPQSEVTLPALAGMLRAQYGQITSGLDELKKFGWKRQQTLDLLKAASGYEFESRNEIERHPDRAKIIPAIAEAVNKKVIELRPKTQTEISEAK